MAKLSDILSAKSGTPAEQFVVALESSIERNVKKRAPSRYYSPSSLRCVRNMYYKRILAEQEGGVRSASLIGITETGSARHDSVQSAIAEMKNCKYWDVEEYIKAHDVPNLVVQGKFGMETMLLNTKYDIRFLCDGIIEFEGETYIFEYKTEVSFKFNKRKGVDPAHYAQACTYAMCFDIPKVMFVYENRDLCSKKGYVLDVTPEMIEELVTHPIDLCEWYLEQGIVPEEKNLDACTYCEYKGRCRRDDREKV